MEDQIFRILVPLKGRCLCYVHGRIQSHSGSKRQTDYPCKVQLASYKMLKEKATNVERRQLAETGILRCAFLLRDDVETIHAATEVLAEAKLSPELKNEALYYRAKAYKNQKADKKALDDFRELAKDTRNSYGAEAKYQKMLGIGTTK